MNVGRVVLVPAMVTVASAEVFAIQARLFGDPGRWPTDWMNFRARCGSAG